MNEHEPQHAQLGTECPAEIAKAPRARAEWDRIVGDLTTSGHITTVDRGTLLAYCLKYGQWLDYEAEGQWSKSNEALRFVLKAAAELGLTPTSRTRVHATKPPEVDEFAQYAATRPAPGLALVKK